MVMQTAKKLLLSLGVIAVFIIYSFQQRHETGAVIAPPSMNMSSSSSAVPSNTTTNTTTVATYKDGTYTGDPADAFYGNIQVQATISGGKLTDVKFLQYPNDRQNSIYINSQAMPYLMQEAIQAQSSRVDIISGATDSSQAFMQSLSSALAQAQ